jgi:alpha-beta hydrolase superfamily lysophospholipase
MDSQSIRRQEKELEFHRQFHTLRFKANDMDFAFQWAMGSAVHGGASIGGGFYAASRMKDGDPESWVREWMALAGRVEQRGLGMLAAGHPVSARETLLRAFVYYRATLGAMLPADGRFKPAVRKMRACFQKAGFLQEIPVETFSIPFAGGALPGYFHQASRGGEPRRTLLMIGGGETFAEDLYLYIAPAALRRGYNFAAVDLPGQGDLPFAGVYFRPDVEIPMRAVLDCLLSRPDVDPQRLAACGISAGGYMVPRAAVHDGRIRACIANSLLFDLHEIFRHSPIPRLKGLVGWMADRKAPFQMRMLRLIAWRWGLPLDDVSAMVEKNRDCVFDPAGIACPTLILVGEGEYANPEVRRQHRHAMRVMPNPGNRLIIGPADEGAAGHCMGENLGLMSALAFDWLDEVFAGQGRGIE